MALIDTPEGARQVTYICSTGDDPPYLSGWTVTFDVGASTTGKVEHTMAEVAMNAALDWLREEYPDAAINASRRYTGDVDGAPWPETDE